MPITYQSIRRHVRLIAGIAGAVVACGGAASALMVYSDLAPATRGYVKEMAKLETDSAFQVATARIANLQRESSETRLQLNKIRKENLRNSRWALAEQLRIATDNPARQILQRQIEQIDDDLTDVNAERDRLRTPSP